MDPYTLAYLAGHSHFSTTKRYVHPQADTVRAAMERARGVKGGHSFGHSDEKAAGTRSAPIAVTDNDFRGLVGRGEWIRTTDLLVPNQHISTTYRHRLLKTRDLHALGLDPIWTLKAKLWRTGSPLDPAWTLISTLVIHMLSRTRAVASAFRKPDQNILLRRDFQGAI